jgi:hypothetical protein
MRRRPPTEAASELKPNQWALYEPLTVSLALFGHVDDVLRECLPSTIGVAINPEDGFVSLDHLPSIVQRAAQNGNGIGGRTCGMVLEIPDHGWLSIVEAGARPVSQPSAPAGLWTHWAVCGAGDYGRTPDGLARMADQRKA